MGKPHNWFEEFFSEQVTEQEFSLDTPLDVQYNCCKQLVTSKNLV